MSYHGESQGVYGDGLGGADRFVLQDYFQSGALNSVTRMPGDDDRLGVDADGTAFTEYLRATNCGARAPHLQPDSHRGVINRARASLMQPHNQSRLAQQLVERTKDVAGAEAILSRFPTLMQGFVRNLNLHTENIGTDPAQAEGQLASNFLDDRESFVRQNIHLFTNAEDAAMRYNCGEYRSLYWDRNRALDAEGDNKPGLPLNVSQKNSSNPSDFSTPSAGVFGAGNASGYQGRVLHARGTREPPIMVLPRAGRLGGTSVEPNVSRYGMTNRDTFSRGERTHRAEDRDRNNEMWTALQERSDRRPQNIRSRTLKETIRGDLSTLGAPLELEASKLHREKFSFAGAAGGAMSDRQRESCAAIDQLRKVSDVYRPNRFAETLGRGAPQLLSVLRN